MLRKVVVSGIGPADLHVVMYLFKVSGPTGGKSEKFQAGEHWTEGAAAPKKRSRRGHGSRAVKRGKKGIDEPNDIRISGMVCSSIIQEPSAVSRMTLLGCHVGYHKKAQPHGRSFEHAAHLLGCCTTDVPGLDHRPLGSAGEAAALCWQYACRLQL